MSTLHYKIRSFLVIGFLSHLFGCAGSPMQLSSMSEEELKSQNAFSLCNAYNYNKNAKVKGELQRRGSLTDKEWQLVDSGYIQVGMSELALICLRGAPVPGFGTINVSSGSWGQEKQYVYVDAFGGRKYIYVRNGKVTSWQY